MAAHWKYALLTLQQPFPNRSMTASFKVEDYALPHLAGMEPYVPGIQPNDTDWIKLNTNENPFPPSPRVSAAIIEALSNGGERLRLYPNPTSAKLREALAAYHKVEVSNVIVGNGSDEILTLLMRCFSGARNTAGFAVPSYSLYPILANAQGAKCVECPFERDFKLDGAGIEDCGASVFFLTSPNAPSGIGFTNQAISAVLERFPGLFVVDEAYAAFAEQDALPLLGAYPNLCIVRTFSKSHGLAGLRVGYALASPEVIRLLDAVRDSYNLDHLAQIGALAALSDPGYYQGTISKMVRIRDTYLKALRQRGWFAYDSQSNFIFTEPVDAAGGKGPDVAHALYTWLKERKILVRYFGGHPLTRSFVRITVGNEDAMQRLLEALDVWAPSK